ncbi:MAG: AAA family ATPase [bacterium]
MEKFLALSIQDFEQMRTGNFVYIDKTHFIYQMVRVPQAYYFLARPRRFGKTLLVSTLKALFEGRKELFKGLWIEKSDWHWKAHPVVTFDFSEIDLTNAEVLQKSLLFTLDQIAAEHGVKLTAGDLLAKKFVELVVELHKKYREKVIILIDEYDKPIITHLGKGDEALEIARQNRDLMKSFFGVLKGANMAARVRMLFITGISKFSKVSIFSDLNNLQDLSMHASYANVLGYSQDELEKHFGNWISELAETQQTTKDNILLALREWYNGYRFTEEDLLMYNPYSIVNVFSEKKFKNYWFESATPSFLVNLVNEKKLPIPEIEHLEVQDSVFSTYELDNLRPEALLFQTGYVTIHDYDGTLYRLGYPNQEVKTSFLSYLYNSIVEITDSTQKAQFRRLHEYLDREDLDQFIQTTNAILSAIPFTHIQGQDEHFYHTVFYLMLSGSGVLVHTEVLTSKGRMDIAVEFNDKVYVVELKCNQSAAEAIKQIRDKGYHEKYRQSDRRVILLGINFDTQQRAITDWQQEPVA